MSRTLMYGPHPLGLCQCGCGQRTKFHNGNNARLGYVKGQPRLFRHGHRPSGMEPNAVYTRIRSNGVRRLGHRAIVEVVLGRSLPTSACVHHVDGNKHNNAYRNLVVCESESYHQLLHLRQRIRDAGGNPNADYVCGRCQHVKPRSEFYVLKSGRYSGSVVLPCKVTPDRDGDRVCAECLLETAVDA